MKKSSFELGIIVIAKTLKTTYQVVARLQIAKAIQYVNEHTTNEDYKLDSYDPSDMYDVPASDMYYVLRINSTPSNSDIELGQYVISPVHNDCDNPLSLLK